jgi:hypothetical protein
MMFFLCGSMEYMFGEAPAPRNMGWLVTADCLNILCHAWVLSEEVNGMCGTCRQYVDAI